MPQYRIDSVGGTREWQGNYGPMVDHQITVTDLSNNQQIQTYIAQKQTSPAPTVGQTIEGEIVQDNRGNPKLKKAYSGGGGGRSGPGGMSPEREARVVRQHSQKVAADLLALKYRGGVPQGVSLFDELKTIVGLLEQHVAEAKPAPSPADTGIPTQQQGFQPTPVPSEDIPF